MAADKPGELLEHNTIIENLNPPCEIADAAAWVKPGKIMRETTITTEGAIATIDFCAAHHIPYMLLTGYGICLALRMTVTLRKWWISWICRG